MVFALPSARSRWGVGRASFVKAVGIDSRVRAAGVSVFCAEGAVAAPPSAMLVIPFGPLCAVARPDFWLAGPHLTFVSQKTWVSGIGISDRGNPEAWYRVPGGSVDSVQPRALHTSVVLTCPWALLPSCAVCHEPDMLIGSQLLKD